MKTLIKTTLILFLLVAYSCSEDDDNNTTDDNTDDTVALPEATITAMNPISGPKTTVITFTGTNFGTDTSAVQIFFDDIEATVSNLTDTEITTAVPARAYFGEVRIVIDGTAFTDFTFNYEIVDIQVSTFAGSDEGFMNGTDANAQFNFPTGIATDAAGNFYVADFENHRIRKITPEGEVSTFAGSGIDGDADGTAENAQFNLPAGIAIDSQDNVYVADFRNHSIRKITPAGVVSTIAGNGTAGFEDDNGINAQFNAPSGIAIDEQDNCYVADSNNHKIRKIDPAGNVTTVVGSTQGFEDGDRTTAQFDRPFGVTVAADGTLYVADSFNHRIRKIDTEGNVTTVAGSTEGFTDGDSATAEFDIPAALTLDALGNLYIADFSNNSIRKLSTDGQVTTIAGTGDEGDQDGTGATAQFNSPQGIFIDETFTIYVVDSGNHKIRKITQE